MIEVAKRTDDALLVAIGGERLPRIVREQGARFEKDEDLDAFEAVSLRAASPEHPETCTLELAILLADALQDGLSHGTLDGYAETALLMANSVQDNDNQGYFDHRFESIGASYFEQPARAAPVIAGLRYLYESDSHFLTYHTRQYDPVLAPERMIPLVDFPAASS